MFISSNEKSIINARIDLLEARVNSLTAMLTQGAASQPEKEKRKGTTWNAKSKSAASERMKKYWAEKKAKKEAA